MSICLFHLEINNEKEVFLIGQGWVKRYEFRNRLVNFNIYYITLSVPGNLWVSTFFTCEEPEEYIFDLTHVSSQGYSCLKAWTNRIGILYYVFCDEDACRILASLRLLKQRKVFLTVPKWAKRYSCLRECIYGDFFLFCYVFSNAEVWNSVMFKLN